MYHSDLLITGASSQIGRCLVNRAPGRYARVACVSRRPGAGDGLEWRQWDLALGWPESLAARRLVHAAPLALLPPLMAEAAGRGLERVVAFSSTSASAKAESRDPDERRVAASLAESETGLRQACERAGVRCTVLRPTLVYGIGLDRNLTVLAAVVRRLRFLPLPAGGRGLRQPVHADDLAAICLDVLEAGEEAAGTFELAGGSAISYRDMAAALFHAQGLPARFVPCPRWAARTGIRLLRMFPGRDELTPALVDRIGEDLVFDDGEARRKLGWNPRPFDPRAAVSRVRETSGR